jgi:hypothetical protein
MNQIVEVYCDNDLYRIQDKINEYLAEYSEKSIAHIIYQVSNGYHTVIVVFTQQGETK